MKLSDELFGPNKEVVYRQLASDIGGEFKFVDAYNPLRVEFSVKNSRNP